MRTSQLAAAAGLATLCTLMAAPAQAGNITTPASTCRPYAVQDAAALNANRPAPAYTYNADAASARYVICPVVRNADNNGVIVVIRGSKSANTVINCNVYSYAPTGALMAVKSQAIVVNPFAASFSFAAAETNQFGHMNVLCLLPPGNGGRLFSIQTWD